MKLTDEQHKANDDYCRVSCGSSEARRRKCRNETRCRNVQLRVFGEEKQGKEGVARMKMWALKRITDGRYAAGNYEARQYLSSLVLARKWHTRAEARHEAMSLDVVVKVEITAKEC